MLVSLPALSVAPLSTIQASHVVSSERPPNSTCTPIESNVNARNPFIFDVWITWRDGAREHVQISRDGFFALDGVRRRLIGFDLGTTGMARAFWDDNDLKVIEKELGYLESLGVRLIALDLFYVGKDRERALYTPVLDMLFEHKMFVFAALIGKGLPGFSLAGPRNSTMNFAIRLRGHGADTMGDWAHRWLDIVTSYRNVVALSIENELDVPPQGLSYSAENVAEYLRWLFGLVRCETRLPLTSKLTAETNVRLDVKKTVLSLVDFAAMDVYAYDLTALHEKLDRAIAFLTVSGHRQTGWWASELNGKTEPDPAIVWKMDASKLTAAYIDSAFEHGASVVVLFPMNCARQPDAAFFHADGMPSPALVSLSSYMRRLR